MNLNYLYLFLAGIVVMEFIFPVIQAIVEMIVSWIEVIKGIAVYKVQCINKAVEDLDQPEVSSNVIGYEIPSEEDYEEDEDEPEENKMKYKGKIGF